MRDLRWVQDVRSDSTWASTSGQSLSVEPGICAGCGVVTLVVGSSVAPEAGLGLQTVSDLCTLIGITDEHTESGLEGLHLALDTDIVDHEAAIGLSGVGITEEIPGGEFSKNSGILNRNDETDLLGT